MRDPNRIDIYIEQLREYWKAHPDLRFAQIMVNFFRYLDIDPFYIEDENLFKYFESFGKDI